MRALGGKQNRMVLESGHRFGEVGPLQDALARLLPPKLKGSCQTVVAVVGPRIMGRDIHGLGLGIPIEVQTHVLPVADMAADILAIPETVAINSGKGNPAERAQADGAHGLALAVGIEHPVGHMEARKLALYTIDLLLRRLSDAVLLQVVVQIGSSTELDIIRQIGDEIIDWNTAVRLLFQILFGLRPRRCLRHHHLLVLVQRGTVHGCLAFNSLEEWIQARGSPHRIVSIL